MTNQGLPLGSSLRKRLNLRCLLAVGGNQLLKLNAVVLVRRAWSGLCLLSQLINLSIRKAALETHCGSGGAGGDAHTSCSSEDNRDCDAGSNCVDRTLSSRWKQR